MCTTRRMFGCPGRWQAATPGLIEWLAASGFGRQAQIDHTRRLALVSGWLERERLDPVMVDEALIGELLVGYQREGRGRSLTCRSFRLVLTFLRAQGVVPPPAPSVDAGRCAAGRLSGLPGRRAFVAVVHDQDLPAVARLFVSMACGDDPSRVGSLTAADVARFVAAVAEGRRASSVNGIVSGVRSLLRWFYAAGLIATPLAQATPWLARGRVSSLPRLVPPGAAERAAGLLRSSQFGRGPRLRHRHRVRSARVARRRAGRHGARRHRLAPR